jgi:hypothetical protein
MIINFLIRNPVHTEFSALGTLLFRNFGIRNFVIRNFVIRNFVIRNFVPVPHPTNSAGILENSMGDRVIVHAQQAT